MIRTSELVWIDGGSFRMGSEDHYPEEAPVHTVAVDGFWIRPTQVTNREFAEFVDTVRAEYSRGLVAILEGREDEGLGHLRKVLEWDSRHFNTLIKIGEVLRSQGKYAEAIDAYKAFLRNYRRSPKAGAAQFAVAHWPAWRGRSDFPSHQ